MPSIAFSLYAAVEILCRSILHDKSKQISVGELIIVFNSICGMSCSKLTQVIVINYSQGKPIWWRLGY